MPGALWLDSFPVGLFWMEIAFRSSHSCCLPGRRGGFPFLTHSLLTWLTGGLSSLHDDVSLRLLPYFSTTSNVRRHETKGNESILREACQMPSLSQLIAYRNLSSFFFSRCSSSPNGWKSPVWNLHDADCSWRLRTANSIRGTRRETEKRVVVGGLGFSFLECQTRILCSNAGHEKTSRQRGCAE